MLLTLAVVSAVVVAIPVPAHAYTCDGPNDPVCIALGTVCLIKEKAKVPVEFCDLG
ncbi:MAG: hypothetical protein ACRDI3_05805 [Actinomycetota bacterium]